MQCHRIAVSALQGTVIALLWALTTAGVRAEDAVDLTAAAKQFVTSCGVCHTVEPGAPIRQGPNLNGVYGRKAATLAEFPGYSDALKKASADGLVWKDDVLDKWIAGAADYIPGVAMMYAQPDPEKRKLVIAYLKSLSGAAAAAPAKPANP